MPHSAWMPNADNWCPYYEIADVVAWAELLRHHLPALLAKLVAICAYDESDYALPSAQA